MKASRRTAPASPAPSTTSTAAEPATDAGEQAPAARKTRPPSTIPPFAARSAKAERPRGPTIQDVMAKARELSPDAAKQAMKARLTAPQFTLAEQSRNVYLAQPAAGTTPEQLLDPEFWTHVSGKLKPNDRIDVRPLDGAFFMELLVLSANRLHARVAPLIHVDLEAVNPEDMESPSASSGYAIRWVNPVAKFRITRLSDRKTVREGFDTRDQAAGHLAEYLQALKK